MGCPRVLTFGALMPTKPPPQLIERDGKKYCSSCGLHFAFDAKPTISKAFVEHVRQDHRPLPTRAPTHSRGASRAN